MLPLVCLVPGENIAHHPSCKQHLPAGELSHVVLTSSYWLTCKRRYFSSRSLLVESAILQGEQKLGSKRSTVTWRLAGSLQTTHNWYHSCRQSQALYHWFAVEVFSGITVRRTKLTSLRGAIFWQEFHSFTKPPLLRRSRLTGGGSPIGFVPVECKVPVECEVGDAINSHAFYP